MSARRPYQSRLREEQTRQTRTLILEALIDLVNAEGVAELSIRDLAARAGVAERTVYRHFPDRQALVDALGEHVAERSKWLEISDVDRDRGPGGATAAELVELLPQAYARFDAAERELRALVLLNLDPARTASVSRAHRDEIARVVARCYPSLDDGEVAEATAVLALLGSSRTWLRFRDEAGLSPAQAARAAQRAARAVIADLEARLASRAG